jgi:hypothetical protein
VKTVNIPFVGYLDIEILKSTVPNPTFRKLIHWIDYINWKRRGKPVPPPHLYKQQVVRNYADKYGLKILVETGTFYGDMIEAMKHCFDGIYSIELSKALYEKAATRFSAEKNIEIIHGDSGLELGNLINRVNQPILFWLDGHYSGGVTARGVKDTPIYDELEQIFNNQASKYVVLIDDARCFGARADYPSIQLLSDFIKTKMHDAKIEIECDIIRITL